MSYFQNLFANEYQGVLALGDYKGFSLTYKVPSNKNKGEIFNCWNYEPYDLSTNNTLTFNFAYDSQSLFKNIASISVNVAGSVPSATMASEIANILNANSDFANFFTASIQNTILNGPNLVYIRQLKPSNVFRTYISNSGAELSLKFNKNGGVADIPSYFDKDSIVNRFAFPEANNQLIRLSHTITGNTVANPTVITTLLPHGLTTGNTVYIVQSNSTPSINGAQVVTVTGANTFTIAVNVTTAGTTGEFLSSVEKQIVSDAGIDYTTMFADWQHLKGRTQSFVFAKNTIDGSNRITSQIQYNAGSVVGQLVKKRVYTYDSSNTNPTTTLELPYILTANDLLTP